ncbi:hypothetical protein GWK47_014653 [Chionoecetes opilio]|uniref:Uncharacterized protein n=1 Tax=Chionoecetes opilio TaxID=41210 RepID=A0A8J4XUI6_CHIOP|nr:hypothetical protein GWK47_014653 [Chionoecetes opilio]
MLYAATVLHSVSRSCELPKGTCPQQWPEVYGHVARFTDIQNKAMKKSGSHNSQIRVDLLYAFTVIIYHKTSNWNSVNEARRELFSTKRNRPMKRFPQRKKPFCSTTARSHTSWNSGQQWINVAEAVPTPEVLWMTLESATIPASCLSNLPGSNLRRCSELGSSVAAKRHVRRTMLMQRRREVPELCSGLM